MLFVCPEFLLIFISFQVFSSIIYDIIICLFFFFKRTVPFNLFCFRFNFALQMKSHSAPLLETTLFSSFVKCIAFFVIQKKCSLYSTCLLFDFQTFLSYISFTCSHPGEDCEPYRMLILLSSAFVKF